MAPSKQPTLPEKKGSSKKAASSTELPINHAQFITLADGTQVGSSNRLAVQPWQQAILIALVQWDRGQSNQVMSPASLGVPIYQQ
jgi:hypothetical protein